MLNKVSVEVIENGGIKKLAIGGRIVEDIIVYENMAVLFVEHYTSREGLSRIKTERYIS